MDMIDKLLESPDDFRFSDYSRDPHSLHYTDSDAVAFGFWRGELYYREEATHDDLAIYLKNKGVLPSNKSGNPREFMAPAGRYWRDHSAVSFWSVPSLEELEKVVAEFGLGDDAWVEYDIILGSMPLPDAIAKLSGTEKVELSSQEWEKLAALQHLMPDVKKELVGSDKRRVGSGKHGAIAAKAGYRSPAEYAAARQQSESAAHLFLGTLDS